MSRKCLGRQAHLSPSRAPCRTSHTPSRDMVSSARTTCGACVVDVSWTCRGRVVGVSWTCLAQPAQSHLWMPLEELGNRLRRGRETCEAASQGRCRFTRSGGGLRVLALLPHAQGERLGRLQRVEGLREGRETGWRAGEPAASWPCTRGRWRLEWGGVDMHMHMLHVHMCMCMHMCMWVGGGGA